MEDLLGVAVADAEVGEEGERGGRGQVEREHLEDEVLHAQHLALGVRVVRDVHKLRHFRRVHLFVFPVTATKANICN